MSPAPTDGGYVCSIHTQASSPLHSPLAIERKGMGTGIKLMSKETKMIDQDERPQRDLHTQSKSDDQGS